MPGSELRNLLDMRRDITVQLEKWVPDSDISEVNKLGTLRTFYAEVCLRLFTVSR
jgi:hypothetical protein